MGGPPTSRFRPPPFGLLDRLLLRELLRLFGSTLGGVVVVYLVIDFADRAHGFGGHGWGRAAAELYLNKAAVVTYQLAPAALIIAAGLLVTQLARRGELTALLALGVRPLRLAAPVAAFAAALGIAVFWLGEKVVVRADARAEEIQVKRFNRWGDWATYHWGSAWVRGRNGRIYHLGLPRVRQQAGRDVLGYEPVTILELEPPFRLARRIDARRIEPAGPPDGKGTPWLLSDVVEIRYGLLGGPGGSLVERRSELATEHFPESPREFELRGGRPSQIPWLALREQVRRRRGLGQGAREYELALAERAAQPLQMVPAALAALGLVLALQKPRKRLPVAGAVAAGIGLSMGLWAVSVVGHALSMGGAAPPNVAGAMPFAASSLVALLTLRRG